MPIELRLLRYFAVVADELHVGRAATRLFISQPALSQQIRTLEDQVGVPLFIRHPRGMELTEMGEALLRQTHPEAGVDVRELTTPEQLDALHEGSIDLGLVREPVEDSRLARRSLLVEPLGVSLPAAHPLVAREHVSLRDLEGELFVCFPRTWAPSLHDLLVTALRDAGVQVRFQDSAHLSTTQGMVAAGLGLTFSAHPWLQDVQGIVWRPLSDVTIEIRTAAAWRAGNRSPLLRTLVDSLPQG